MKKIIFALFFALFVCASVTCVCATDYYGDSVANPDLNGNNDIPDQPDLNNKSLLAPEFQVEHPCPRPGGAIWTPNDLLSIM